MHTTTHGVNERQQTRQCYDNVDDSRNSDFDVSRNVCVHFQRNIIPVFWRQGGKTQTFIYCLVIQRRYVLRFEPHNEHGRVRIQVKWLCFMQIHLLFVRIPSRKRKSLCSKKFKFVYTLFSCVLHIFYSFYAPMDGGGDGVNSTLYRPRLL